jgi:hypothetical protein
MKRAYSVTDTPLFPRMTSYTTSSSVQNINGKSLIGPLEQLDTIADTSFTFDGDSISLLDSSVTSAGKDDLKTALKAAENAMERMKKERDDARRGEARVKEAIRKKKWEVVVDAVQAELDRTEEYKATLKTLKDLFKGM